MEYLFCPSKMSSPEMTGQKQINISDRSTILTGRRGCVMVVLTKQKNIVSYFHWSLYTLCFCCNTVVRQKPVLSGMLCFC